MQASHISLILSCESRNQDWYIDSTRAVIRLGLSAQESGIPRGLWQDPHLFFFLARLIELLLISLLFSVT